MKIGTLFSGIGAPEQALKRMGLNHSVAFACEFDKYARQSYAANYAIDEAHFHKDINDMDGTQYRGKVDVIIGGSPCQDFSIAGLRAGLDGHRGQLIWQYYRIIKEIMPPIFIYENVKGMLSDKKQKQKDKYGQTFKDFLEVFEGLGYKTKWQVLNTKDYGVPQNRERVYVVGFLNNEDYESFEFAPKIPLVKRIRDVLESDVDEKYYMNTARYAMCIDDIARTLRVGGKSSDSKKHCYDLIREPKILDFTNSFNEANIREYENYSPTLRSCRFGLAVAYDYRIRKLTPRECLRLQDFGDDFKIIVSNTQAYKQAGNSMSVNVLEMIFNQIRIAKCKLKKTMK